MSEEYELHETFSGTVLAFCGEFGMEGVFVYREDGWDFVPHGHSAWDRHHQEVFRNGRSEKLTLDDLSEKNIPLPTAEQRETSPTAIAWKNTAKDRMPLNEVPGHLVTEFTVDNRAVYVVMVDDKGEWNYDGRQLWPDRAFWNESEATKCATQSQNDRFLYTVKEVFLRIDASNTQLIAELKPGAFEHITIKDVVGKLPAPPDSKPTAEPDEKRSQSKLGAFLSNFWKRG